MMKKTSKKGISVTSGTRAAAPRVFAGIAGTGNYLPVIDRPAVSLSGIFFKPHFGQFDMVLHWQVLMVEIIFLQVYKFLKKNGLHRFYAAVYMWLTGIMCVFMVYFRIPFRDDLISTGSPYSRPVLIHVP